MRFSQYLDQETLGEDLPITPEWARRQAEKRRVAEYKQQAKDFAFGCFLLVVLGATVWFFVCGGMGGQR